MSSLFFVIIIFLPSSVSNWDIVTSADELMNLAMVEREFHEVLGDLIIEWQNLLTSTDIFTSQSSKLNNYYLEGKDKSINTFIQQFRVLSKRIEMYDEIWASVGNTETVIIEVADMFNLTISPTYKEDLKGAAKSLFTLQKVYGFLPYHMAQGKLGPITTRAFLKVEDCIQIAQIAAELNAYNFYKYEVGWYEAALKLTTDEKQKQEILKLFRRASMKHDEVFHNKDLEEFDEDNPVLFHYPLTEATVEQQFQGALRYYTDEPLVVLRQGRISSYNSLCKGIVLQTPNELKNLKCQLRTFNKAVFLIRPVKLEYLKKNPQVVMFHDIVYDKEIAMIKKLTKKQGMERSSVRSKDITDHRTSHTAWLNGDSDPNIAKISKRIQDLTGFNTDETSAEDYQVLNYGLGGTYAYHKDYLPRANNYSNDEDDPDKDIMLGGNRIATMLLYLTDVKYGGSTAFPDLWISAKPEKGSAILWYNMNKELNGANNYSEHGGCPVVLGNKWAINKWILTYGQMLKFKCGEDWSFPEED